LDEDQQFFLHFNNLEWLKDIDYVQPWLQIPCRREGVPEMCSCVLEHTAKKDLVDETWMLNSIIFFEGTKTSGI
jgi:hypothetical protein